MRKTRGRPPKLEEERYLFKTIRFPPELWAELEAMAPARGRSAIVQEALRRELARLKRRAREAAERAAEVPDVVEETDWRRAEADSQGH